MHNFPPYLLTVVIPLFFHKNKSKSSIPDCKKCTKLGYFMLLMIFVRALIQNYYILGIYSLWATHKVSHHPVYCDCANGDTLEEE